MYEIEFYEDKSGYSEVQEYIKELKKTDFYMHILKITSL